MRIRKTAGRCNRCNKWVALDEFEVIVDLTIAAITPAWVASHQNHETCGTECFAEVSRLTRQVLAEHPLCAPCWHAMDKVRPLRAGIEKIVEEGPAALIPPSMQFQWKRVSRG